MPIDSQGKERIKIACRTNVGYLYVPPPESIANVHLHNTQENALPIIELGTTAVWSKQKKSQKGKIATEISYADNCGGTKAAA